MTSIIVQIDAKKLQLITTKERIFKFLEAARKETPEESKTNLLIKDFISICFTADELKEYQHNEN